MKTLQKMIKDLTGINVKKNKINDYLESNKLDLQGAYLQGAKITKSQLEQLIIEEDK